MWSLGASVGVTSSTHGWWHVLDAHLRVLDACFRHVHSGVFTARTRPSPYSCIGDTCSIWLCTTLYLCSSNGHQSTMPACVCSSSGHQSTMPACVCSSSGHQSTMPACGTYINKITTFTVVTANLQRMIFLLVLYMLLHLLLLIFYVMEEFLKGGLRC
jgi:hypothetical protein